jgi:hypothetical protein
MTTTSWLALEKIMDASTAFSKYDWYQTIVIELSY